METYASILAVLISGKTYVILHPAYPRHRNRKIAELADIHLILYTKDIRVLNLDTEHIDFICTSELQEVVPSSSGIHSEKNENAYIIFTSGSTGEPKGVPISRNNLNAFYNAYSHLDWQLDENDRMLQMFELTFDVSIVSFLFPLTIGAAGLHHILSSGNVPGISCPHPSAVIWILPVIFHCVDKDQFSFSAFIKFLRENIPT